jgi:hypothetical protein
MPDKCDLSSKNVADSVQEKFSTFIGQIRPFIGGSSNLVEIRAARQIINLYDR